MKELKTKDKITFKVKKNRDLSVSGKYNAYDFYLDDGTTYIGTRKGVKGVKNTKFVDLFTATGILLNQVPNVKEVPDTATQAIQKILNETVGKEEIENNLPSPLSYPSSQVKVFESQTKITNSKYELWTVFQINIETKTNPINDELIKVLEKNKNWNLMGYELSGKRIEDTIQMKMRLIIHSQSPLTTNQVINYLGENFKIKNVKISQPTNQNTKKSIKTKKKRKVRRKKFSS